MKETFLILASVLFALPSISNANVQGESDTRRWCEVQLENASGRVLDVFEDESCNVAMSECEAMRQTYSEEHRGRLRCNITDQTDRPPREVIDREEFDARNPRRSLERCQLNLAQDYRCTNDLDLSCTPCALRRGETRSFYSVYVDEKIYVNTFHGYSYNPIQSYYYCENRRQNSYECQSPRSTYFCGPCTYEPYNNHSQFNIYRRY